MPTTRSTRQRAGALFRPMRLRILEALGEPDTSAGVARRLGAPRQKVNYHVRELERHGLVELLEERKRGNCIERLLRATSRSYLAGAEVVRGLATDSPDTLEANAPFSPAQLVAGAARAIADVADLRAGADEARQPLTTFAVGTEVRLAGAGSRAAFFDELGRVVARLVERYHDPRAPNGRVFRVFGGVYPSLRERRRGR